MDFLPAVRSETLDDAIVKTVAFFDVLEYVLTIEELSERLLGFDASASEVERGVRASGRVEVRERDGHMYVSLPGRVTLIDQRVQYGAADSRLWDRVQRYAWVFRCVPFLRGVYVCNRLAITQGTPGSDIDIFVVAQEGRMFLVRTLLLMWFQILGVRRYGRKVPGRFCLSFFVDTAGADLRPLLLPSEDVYFAYWLLLLQPVMRGFDIYEVNPWLREYFSERLLRTRAGVSHRYPVNFFGYLFRRVFEGRLGRFIEEKLSTWQLARARAKHQSLGAPEGVVLDEHCLKFHDRDMRKVYLQKWKDVL